MLLAIIDDIKEMAASAFFSSQCMISIKLKEFSGANASGSYDPGITQAVWIKF
jgi:hypothetical protein